MAEVALQRPELAAAAPGRAVRIAGFFGKLARTKPLGFVGLLIIVAMLVLAAFPSVFATYNPAQVGVGPRLRNFCLGPTDSFLCPSRTEGTSIPGLGTINAQVVQGVHSQPLGTDKLGRDNYSRIVYGARWAAYVGFGAVAISSVLALVLGVTTGYFLGAYDSLMQRIVDAIMALPVLVVLLALPQMIGDLDLDGPLPLDEPRITFFKLVVILGIIGAAGGSRVIRASVISVRAAQYLEAARVVGCSDARVMLRHVVPNIFGPLMVQATIGLGGVILAESALSFLGFGVVDPNKPTWGQMLNLGQTVAVVEPWQAVWPGLFIALAVFSFNMLGDALRDMLDPRLRGAGGGFN